MVVSVDKAKESGVKVRSILPRKSNELGMFQQKSYN